MHEFFLELEIELCYRNCLMSVLIINTFFYPYPSHSVTITHLISISVI